MDSGLDCCYESGRARYYLHWLKDTQQVSRAESLFTSGHGKVLPELPSEKIFAIVDVKDEFWHVCLDKEISYLTTCETLFRKYRWKRLVFWITDESGRIPAPTEWRSFRAPGNRCGCQRHSDKCVRWENLRHHSRSLSAAYRATGAVSSNWNPVEVR